MPERGREGEEFAKTTRMSPVHRFVGQMNPLVPFPVFSGPGQCSVKDCVF